MLAEPSFLYPFSTDIIMSRGLQTPQIIKKSALRGIFFLKMFGSSKIMLIFAATFML